MIATADLKAQTRRELADLAKNYGVPGWHALKKDELIHEIAKVQRRMRRQNAKPAAKSASSKAAKSESRQGKQRSAQTRVKDSAKSPAVKATAAKGSARKDTAPKVTAPKVTASKGSATKGSASKSASVKKSRSVSATASKSGSDGVARGASSATGLNGAAAARAATKKTAAQKADQKRLNKPMPKLPEPRIDPKTARIRAQIRRRRETMQKNKDLSTGTLVAGAAVKNGASRSRDGQLHHDRVVLMVRDAYWLQATWEITRASIERAQSSLSERWHTAIPTLRLLAVGDVDGSSAESVCRDIPIHGGVNNWYIDVDEPPSRFRVVVGYSIPGGDFYTLCRSNVVETPRPGECERLDEHWHDIAEDYERIYSLSGGYETDCGDLKEVFEDRLRRSMPLRGEKGQTVTDPSLLRSSKLPFKVDAELIVFGKTLPSASVQVAGKPVKLQSDGSFTVRMQLPDKRQVLPVTAESRDGLRQRTTVVAVERNTKVMEPVELEDRF